MGMSLTLETFEFLGVDSQLTCVGHSGRIEEKYKKVINVLRCLTDRKWGASSTAMKRVYVTLIRSMADDGRISYGSAARAHHKSLM